MIKLLLSAIKATDDQHPEGALEQLMDKGFLKDYEEIMEWDWDDDGKYQLGGGTYKVFLENGNIHYIAISCSRSGSHFTDWYYTIGDVEEVDKFNGAETVTIKVLDNANQGIFAQLMIDTIKKLKDGVDVVLSASQIKGLNVVTSHTSAAGWA